MKSIPEKALERYEQIKRLKRVIYHNVDYEVLSISKYRYGSRVFRILLKEKKENALPLLITVTEYSILDIVPKIMLTPLYEALYRE